MTETIKKASALTPHGKKERIAAICQSYARRLTLQQVADEIGLTAGPLSSWIRKHARFLVITSDERYTLEDRARELQKRANIYLQSGRCIYNTREFKGDTAPRVKTCQRYLTHDRAYCGETIKSGNYCVTHDVELHCAELSRLDQERLTRLKARQQVAA